MDYKPTNNIQLQYYKESNNKLAHKIILMSMLHIYFVYAYIRIWAYAYFVYVLVRFFLSGTVLSNGQNDLGSSSSCTVDHPAEMHP